MLDIIYENHWVFQGILINKDKFLRAILMMKSQDGKMIIVYHNDERNGIPFAQRLFEKVLILFIFYQEELKILQKNILNFCKVMTIKIEKDKK